jgi:PilZ domain
MTDPWLPGEQAAVLVEAADGSRQVVGASRVVFDDAVCRLRLSRALAEAHERPMMVSLGSGRAQRFAPVVRSEQSEGELSVWTPSRWYRASDRRAHPRYPVLLPATITSGDVSSPARCLDISSTGSVVETPFWRPERFVLSVPHNGETLCLPCRTVSVQPFLGGVVIHAQFDEVDACVKVGLGELVSAAGVEFADAQLFLVGRANDSIQPLR